MSGIAEWQIEELQDRISRFKCEPTPEAMLELVTLIDKLFDLVKAVAK